MFGERARRRHVPPSSIKVWQWKLMASLAWSMVSSSVSPAEKQPGRSGTTTPKASGGVARFDGDDRISRSRPSLPDQTGLFAQLGAPDPRPNPFRMRTLSVRRAPDGCRWCASRIAAEV